MNLKMLRGSRGRRWGAGVDVGVGVMMSWFGGGTAMLMMLRVGGWVNWLGGLKIESGRVGSLATGRDESWL